MKLYELIVGIGYIMFPIYLYHYKEIVTISDVLIIQMLILIWWKIK